MRAKSTFNAGLAGGVKGDKPEPKIAFRSRRINPGLTGALLNVKRHVSIEYIRLYIYFSLLFSTFTYSLSYLSFSARVRVRGGLRVKGAKGGLLERMVKGE